MGGREEHDSDKREKKIQLTDQSEMPAAGAAAAGQEVINTCFYLDVAVIIES